MPDETGLPHPIHGGSCDRFRSAKKKIFILGDSFSEGWGVPCDATYPSLLNTRHQVSNGGVHGGSPAYYVLGARRNLVRISPDVLILQLFDNDLHDLDQLEPFLEHDSSGKILRARPRGLGFLPSGRISRAIRERSDYRLIRRVYKKWIGHPEPIKYYRPGREPTEPLLVHGQALERFGRPTAITDFQRQYNGQFEFYTYRTIQSIPPESLWGGRMQRMSIYLTQLVSESRKARRDIEILMLYIPAREVFAPGGITGSVAGGRRRLTVPELRRNNPFYQLLRRFSRKWRVRLVDGQDFLHKNAADLYFPGDAHLNRRGHRRVGERLLREISE